MFCAKLDYKSICDSFCSCDNSLCTSQRPDVEETIDTVQLPSKIILLVVIINDNDEITAQCRCDDTNGVGICKCGNDLSEGSGYQIHRWSGSESEQERIINSSGRSSYQTVTLNGNKPQRESITYSKGGKSYQTTSWSENEPQQKGFTYIQDNYNKDASNETTNQSNHTQRINGQKLISGQLRQGTNEMKKSSNFYNEMKEEGNPFHIAPMNQGLQCFCGRISKHYEERVSLIRQSNTPNKRRIKKKIPSPKRAHLDSQSHCPCQCHYQNIHERL